MFLLATLIPFAIIFPPPPFQSAAVRRTELFADGDLYSTSGGAGSPAPEGRFVRVTGQENKNPQGFLQREQDVSGMKFFQHPSPAVTSCPPSLSITDISPQKGRGVVARVHINLNSVIGDYEGEYISEATKDRRYLPSHKHKRTAEDMEWAISRQERRQTATGSYLFRVSDRDIFIDAEDEEKANFTRFLNHSDRPNLRVKCLPVSINGAPRVWFVALHDIKAGEELTFSYGDDYWFDDDEIVA